MLQELRHALTQMTVPVAVVVLHAIGTPLGHPSVESMMTRISHLRICAVAVVAAAAGRCHTCWLSLYPSSLAVKVDIVWSETL